MGRKPKRTHSQIWRDVQKSARELSRLGRWHACRHEDSATIGVPDMSYGLDGTNGWIEFKSVPGWPIQHRLKVRDLTAHQVHWLEERGRAGGSCWLLLSVGEDYILMNHEGPRVLMKQGLPKREHLPVKWLVLKKLDGAFIEELNLGKRGER